jgi:hypothetical protein
MNENQNKNILLVLIAAIIVAVSASFANNYFAYFFISKNLDLTANKNRKPSPISAKPTAIKFNIDESWNWHYSEINAKESHYPVVVLRDGYKAIKIVADKVLMGWNYELLNTSSTVPYMITVKYNLEDGDGFIVNESS